MGIVSFSPSPMLTVLLAPVRALAARLVSGPRCANFFAYASPSQHSAKQLTLPFELEGNSEQGRAAGSHRVVSKTRRHGMGRPFVNRLKVVCEFDTAVSPACAGRMVISGRMADVCAELERMVRHEKLHSSLFTHQSRAE
jgi:hypothetical protein